MVECKSNHIDSNQSTKEIFQMSDIKPETRDLAAAIKAGVTIGKDGVPTPEEGLIGKLLPEGLNVEQYGLASRFNSSMFSAGTLAAGELGADVLKKHKDMKEFTLNIPTVDRDHFHFSMERDYSVRAPGATESVEKHGRVTAVHEVYAADHTRGEYKKAKEEIIALATSTYGSKK